MDPGLRFLLYYLLVFFFVQLGLFGVFKYALTDGVVKAQFRRVWTYIIVEFGMLLGSIVIWHRIVRTCRKRCKRWLGDLLSAFIVMFLVGTHCSVVTYYVLVRPEPHWFAQFCFVCVGLFINLSLFLGAFTAGTFLLESLQSTRFGKILLWPIVRFPLTRGLAFNRTCQTLVAIALAVALTGHGFYVTSRPPLVKSVTVELANLPKEFDGFKIAHLTDIHLGPIVGKHRLNQVVWLTNSLKPDVVTIVGDLFDGYISELLTAVQPLKYLKPKYGTYFSTGNHDYFHEHIDDWIAELKKLRIVTLHNSHTKIVKGANASEPYVCLAGTDDITSEFSTLRGHMMDVRKAIAGCSQAYPIIVMQHQPKGAKKIIETSETKVDLILAGHTHGGQFYILAPLVYFINPYFLGLYQDAASGTQVYVSSGVAFWGPPVKYYCEISLITLRRKD